MSRRQPEFDSVLSNLDFYDTFCKPFVSDDDLERSPHQVGIVEFDAGSFVPIVPEYFDACRLQIGVECVATWAVCVDCVRKEMHMERRDWEGPDNALLVVILFDRRRGRAADADAVASHDGQALFTLKVQERGLHRFAVFGAEHEDMSDFDAFGRL